MWANIDSAPRDGSLIVCWRKDWANPIILRWKTNPRIERELITHKEWAVEHRIIASYFGDPEEYDDYDLASSDSQPTHWHELSELPKEN